jgi:cyanophycinase
MPLNQNSGAIALVGSGEYSLPMQELETQLLHRAISRGKKNTFVQIPTASSHDGDASREK